MGAGVGAGVGVSCMQQGCVGVCAGVGAGVGCCTSGWGGLGAGVGVGLIMGGGSKKRCSAPSIAVPGMAPLRVCVCVCVLPELQRSQGCGRAKCCRAAFLGGGGVELWLPCWMLMPWKVCMCGPWSGMRFVSGHS